MAAVLLLQDELLVGVHGGADFGGGGAWGGAGHAGLDLSLGIFVDGAMLLSGLFDVHGLGSLLLRLSDLLLGDHDLLEDGGVDVVFVVVGDQLLQLFDLLLLHVLELHLLLISLHGCLARLFPVL